MFEIVIVLKIVFAEIQNEPDQEPSLIAWAYWIRLFFYIKSCMHAISRSEASHESERLPFRLFEIRKRFGRTAFFGCPSLFRQRNGGALSADAGSNHTGHLSFQPAFGPPSPGSLGPAARRRSSGRRFGSRPSLILPLQPMSTIGSVMEAQPGIKAVPGPGARRYPGFSDSGPGIKGYPDRLSESKTHEPMKGVSS